MTLHAHLACPDCAEQPVLDAQADDSRMCPQCGRVFLSHAGIWQCLPSTVAQAAIKDSEKQGWQAVYPAHLDDVRESYLQYPYVEEADGVTFYRHAAQQLEIAQKLVGPIEGKTGLDMGGGFGWAAYRFTQSGAQMTLADYNDSTPSGLGGAQVYLDAGHAIQRVRVDAERLPFAAAQFDFVFSCSFLHHLTDLDQCLQHVGRVLKPGGFYIAIMEAFCPWWSSRDRALQNATDIERFQASGINEQVFYQSEYLRAFRQAGLQVSVLNPRWDAVTDDGRIEYGRLVSSSDFEPELLANRRPRSGATGAIARAILTSGVWRVAAAPPVFRLLRTPLLTGSQKLRVLVGRKV